MTVNYTTLLGLAKPVTGTESGTWGDIVNDQITTLVEDALANAATVSVGAGDVTLTTTTGASNQARCAMIIATGSPGVSRNIVAPSQSKFYIVINQSNANVVFKGAATSGVTLAAGTNALVGWNGSDFEIISLSGPSSSIDNEIALFSGTSGKVVKRATTTGILKATSGVIAAATAGTDYAKPDTASTWSAKQTFTATQKIQQTLEKMTVSATAATGTIAYDALTQAALYYTTNASANWTVNFRGDGSTSLDSVMATGESLTLAFLVTQGSTAYYNSAVQIDGNAVTPKWQGGSAPTSGNTSSIDMYVYNIVKTGSATFTVFAAQTQFK